VNRKLLAVNLLLAGLLIWAGMQWRSQYLAAQARERKMRTAKATQQPPSPLPAIPTQPPVQAAGYNNVAQKLLLHPTRNPDIPVEAPEPPPPPPPMPALPKYHGSMNLDGVATAILSAGQDRYKEIKPGETIGQFKLIDVNTRDITFEWNNQQVRKTLNELLDRTVVENSNTVSNAPAAQAAPPPPAIKSQIGPVGEASVFGRRACDPNDNYPDGAVVDGWRKTSSTTPFGKACYWERAGR
jgi:hypothetical protein